MPFYALSKNMQKALVAALMCRLGVSLGEKLAPCLVPWFASVQLISFNGRGNFDPYGNFSLGCGLLFAMAALAGRSLPGGMACLLFGIMASAVAARVYYAGYAASLIPMISYQELPMFRIPMIGACAILCVAAPRRLLASHPRIKSVSK